MDRHTVSVRFGLMSLSTGWAEARRDAARAANLGFDSVSTGDHLRHSEDTPLPVLDGWSVLAAWAATTDRLRLGMLVANIIYRHPVVLAHQAVAVDVISGGRLDVGVGAGIYAVDHAMAGTPPWTLQERLARLREFVEALHVILGGGSSFHGQYYRFDEATILPPAEQRPRPPIVVAALGRGALRVAAQYADVWNTFGGSDLDEETLFTTVARQATILEEHCEDLDRDPTSIRRSLLALPPLTPWRSVEAFARMIDRAQALRFDELILFAPREDEVAVFERVCATVISDSRS